MNVPTIAPREVYQRRGGEKPVHIIDVRTPAEYAGVHAEGAQLVPLDELDVHKVMAERNGAKDQPLYVICKSGSRAASAVRNFHAAGFTNAVNIDGGTSAWEAAGLPVVRGTSNAISLERQVRIAAGILILIGAALTWFVHPAFIIVPAFVGAGLTFAGITDFCGLGILLGKCPWNR